ncbi:MAG: hypothetical protein IJ566_06655 [Cardiobacteriaceae bacterium]|nr:hypothetical protein [Cardiobacteriaceae bacterium]
MRDNRSEEDYHRYIMTPSNKTARLKYILNLQEACEKKINSLLARN